MGQLKELFLSIQQGLMEGVNIEKAERERMSDEDYRLLIYTKKKEDDTDEQ